MAATVIEDQHDVLSLMFQEQSCSDVESICLEEALGTVSIANYTHERATIAACHCAKYANYHAFVLCSLVHIRK